MSTSWRVCACGDPRSQTPRRTVAVGERMWYPPHPCNLGTQAGVAQLDRASVYETEGYRFESCHPRFDAELPMLDIMPLLD